MLEKQILEIFEKIILENYNLEKKDLVLGIPPKKELWDFAFWWFQLARDLKKNPNLIVWELKNFLEKENNNILENLEIAWPYLNIKVSKNIFTDKFLNYIKNSECRPAFTTNDKTIIIDYIWANVWKPLHIGHMCTPNTGQAIINVYKKLWYNVVSDSHIWDWGIIFGKLILAYKKWWNEKELEENAVEHLFELYVKISDEIEKKPELEEQIREEFKKLSEANPESVDFWKSFTKESIKAMNLQLARLSVKPDFNIWESFYEGLNLPKIENYPDLKFSMKDIVKELIEKGIATQNDDNSVWVIFDEKIKIPSCILQKRDWTHWYLASDLAAIKYRVENWNPEKIIYFVDVRQQLHLKQAFEISQKVWWVKKGKLFHAYNWFISLKDWAMSSRKWRIIKLDKLLDEAQERAKKIILEKRDDIFGEELENLGRIIGIWAIKYGYLKRNRESDVIFDWDEFMSFEGNSGPYIQYAYVRARRILTSPLISWKKEKNKWNFNFPQEIELVKSLLKYKEILEETAQKSMPHILASYSYELTKDFNAFYNKVPILNEENQTLKKLRLKLTKKFAETLKESFELLGIEMPKRM